MRFFFFPLQKIKAAIVGQQFYRIHDLPRPVNSELWGHRLVLRNSLKRRRRMKRCTESGGECFEEMEALLFILYINCFEYGMIFIKIKLTLVSLHYFLNLQTPVSTRLLLLLLLRTSNGLTTSVKIQILDEHEVISSMKSSQGRRVTLRSRWGH